jgi:hypothetical protein
MWHLVIRKHSGGYVREQVEDKPAVHELEYWENYHSQHVGNSPGAYYDCGTNEIAIVVNIYESED